MSREGGKKRMKGRRITQVRRIQDPARSFPLNTLIGERAQYHVLLTFHVRGEEGNVWTYGGSEQVNVLENSINKNAANITALVTHSSPSSTPQPTWPWVAPQT